MIISSQRKKILSPKREKNFQKLNLLIPKRKKSFQKLIGLKYL
jgi:hypothetical protein